jgi:hypothetical protein
MKRIVMAVLLTAAFGITGLVRDHGAHAETTKASSPVRLGVFDSRAVAIAYYRSDAHMEYIKNLKAEYAAATEAGDDARAEELSHEGESSQALAHKQGFGSWPVDDLLDRIADDLPAIARNAGVDVIVSKWDIVHADPSLEFVDVTLAMVQPFHPDEAVLKLIRDELPKVDPVPIAELESHEH